MDGAVGDRTLFDLDRFAEFPDLEDKVGTYLYARSASGTTGSQFGIPEALNVEVICRHGQYAGSTCIDTQFAAFARVDVNLHGTPCHNSAHGTEGVLSSPIPYSAMSTSSR
jgi:hypothetical protein